MDEYFNRQVSLMRRLMNDYRDGQLSLNKCIQNLEGISEAIGSESWKNSIFPIILTMEQINAVAITEHRELHDADKMLIEKSLNDLEHLIQHFEETQGQA